MRFNELITGVRADIAIKVFGEDLKRLSDLGNEISNLIKDVPGAADIAVEKIVGLPEIRVTYDRNKIARYGLNIQQVNDLISAGFGGRVTGSVFEGERKFDLVVRLDRKKRQSLDDLDQLFIDLSDGRKIPLNELAEISYKTGAAKISRDNTRRRIVVSVNARDRDLQSIVTDIENIINDNINLPPGYSVSYGGQFENLQSAKKRLSIAVPLALSLIFLLLFFAFGSLREVLIIYTAIPLAAVGGILLLWLREMPFSISAGVGFIALFGIAVLNGIVLIEHLKTLKIQDFRDEDELIIVGAKDRLRAVILTAMAAAMGFLPMAFSTSAGAEVQRPLATVVIGGLITATLLTLVVLPVLYKVFVLKSIRKQKTRSSSGNLLLTLLLFFPAMLFSQSTTRMNLDSLIPMAIERNLQLKAQRLELSKTEALKGNAQLLDKTEVYYFYDENNLAINNLPVGVFGIQQDMRFPTVYSSEKRLQSSTYQMSQSAYNIQLKLIKRNTLKAYYNYQVAIEKLRLVQQLDSIFSNFSKSAERRFELGETNYLEKITTASKQSQIRLKFEEVKTEVFNAYLDLKTVVQFEDSIQVFDELIIKIPLEKTSIEGSPEMAFYQKRVQVFENTERFEKNKRLPDLSFEFFQGGNSGLGYNLIGYQVGLKIPLLFNGQSSKIRAASIASEVAKVESQDYFFKLNQKLERYEQQLKQISKSLEYYEQEGSSLSREILETAQAGYDNGEIDFFQYIQSLESALEIEINYLNKVKEYNAVIIDINYLTL
jgi:cobalt-zinc-cadmium resistance protein CzcA